MEAAFLNRDSPDFEICKVISLKELDPLALFDLQRIGEAQFSLQEVLFDMDFPGHYLRKIRSVALSFSCISKPYKSLDCTLSLLQHKCRISPAAGGGAYAEKPEGDDDRFRTDKNSISSIAVGSLSLDSGRFDMSFGGERFHPFENAGVLSKWKIELPKVHQFDYGTISDVVLTLRYTSLQGDRRLKELAQNSVDAFMGKAPSLGSRGGSDAGAGTALNRSSVSAADEQSVLVDLKSEYYREFVALTKLDYGVSTISLVGLAGKLPFWVRGHPVAAKSISLYVQTKDEEQAFGGTFHITKGELEMKDGKTMPGGWTVFSLADPQQDVSDWPLRITMPPKSGPGSEILRIMVLFQYKLNRIPIR